MNGGTIGQLLRPLGQSAEYLAKYHPTSIALAASILDRSPRRAYVKGARGYCAPFTYEQRDDRSSIEASRKNWSKATFVDVFHRQLVRSRLHVYIGVSHIKQIRRT